MLLYNKYKLFCYLNLEDSFEIELTIENNVYRVNSFFRHSKKLIRSLILLHFYTYILYPFSPLLYRGAAREYLVFDANILLLVSSDCYKSYFRFD